MAKINTQALNTNTPQGWDEIPPCFRERSELDEMDVLGNNQRMSLFVPGLRTGEPHLESGSMDSIS